MTAREAAFRESFYRVCGNDLVKLRFLQGGRGFLALSVEGQPLTWSIDDPESIVRYQSALADVYARRYLDLNIWETH